MTQELPGTPLRRSKRGQPVVTVAPTASSSSEQVSPGEQIFSRPARAEEVYDEQREGLTSLEGLTSQFYSSFSRTATHSQTKTSATGRRNDRKAREVYSVGDTVLIGTHEGESVAVIAAIWTVTGQDLEPIVRVLVHWFLKPTQLPRIRAAREYVENEIFYTVSSSVAIFPSWIISHCNVSSDTSNHPKAGASHSKPSSKRVSDKNSSASFCCRYGIEQMRGIYYEFSWEHFREAALGSSHDGSGATWELRAHEPPKTPRKKQRTTSVIPAEHAETEDSSMDPAEVQSTVDEEYQETEEPVADEEEEEAIPVPQTPSKKRKNAATTPSRKRTRTASTLAAPTPHSKAALRARARKKQALTVRPPPPPDRADHFQLQLANVSRDPWLRAMHVLHVASRPDALPCREEEYGKILRAVEQLLDEGSGGCVYISGVPGTGKTATVHAVVRELKCMAEQNEANPFTYVEINGLRIPEPAAAYGLLWEAVSGHDTANEGHLKIGSKEALKRLSKHFSVGERIGPGGHACVVLMDELDQLMTSKQDVVYNFFNWPTLVGSKLVVLAVANTMDLPERVMTGRVRSRLGMIRINFQPYTTPQLEKIVHARLTSAKEGCQDNTPDVIAQDGVKFACMKVSSISGDARRVLDICRRTVELVQPQSRTARTDDVKQVIKDMQNSPTAAYLRDLSFHERLMLAALLKCIKKEGVEEIKWGDVQHQHIIYLNILAGEGDPTRRPTLGELSLVLDSLLASRAMLIEDGAVVSRKPEGDRRVILNLEHAEVERVLGEIGGTRWRNALSI